MLLPGLEKFSPQQLFFINFGRVYCGKDRLENFSSLLADTHSPKKIRVNAVVQNSAEFAEAFQCRANQPMNPPHKCQIWQNDDAYA